MLLVGNAALADQEMPNPTMPADMGPMDMMPLPMPQMSQMPMLAPIVPMNLGCTDIIEKDKVYVLTVDVPGISKADIKVSIQDGMLVVEAKRNEEKLKKQEKEAQDGKITVIANERLMTSFVRTFALPKDVEPNSKKIHAKLDDGVLVITLNRIPKKVDEIKVL